MLFKIRNIIPEQSFCYAGLSSFNSMDGSVLPGTETLLESARPSHPGTEWLAFSVRVYWEVVILSNDVRFSPFQTLLNELNFISVSNVICIGKERSLTAFSKQQDN